MADANFEGPKLHELYDEIWKLHIFVDTCAEPLADDKVQDRVYVGVKKCERAISMVNELGLFSNNEILDEVASSEIKYMLLPALLGFFTIQTTRAERLPCVKKAMTFYTDYVRLCKNYEVTDIELPCPDEEEGDRTVVSPTVSRNMDLGAMARTRQAKIEQFHTKKAMESKMKELHNMMEQGQVEDEVKREYYIMQLKLWVSRSMEDIDSIQSEIPILEHMARMKAEKKRHPEHVDEKRRELQYRNQGKPFRPFILTKDMVQKNVFGAGYPAMPTYTIEEFYQQKVDDGTFQLPTTGMGNLSLQERVAEPEHASQAEDDYLREEERKVDDDDSQELQRKRAMDDWKDDHRRGWGNRQNRL